LVRIIRAQHHIYHLAHQLATAACGVKATRQLTGFQQVAAEILIGFVVGAGRVLEEFGQRLGRDKFRLGVDRAAKHLERDTPPQDLLASGRVDGHSRARIVEQLRQLAAAYKMHTVGNAARGRGV